MFNCEFIGEGIVHFRFSDESSMFDGMLRFQEHYESPGFRGKGFTREEFMEWYKTNYGDYDWAGYNYPSHVYQSAESLMDLTEEEKAVRDAVNHPGPYYIIATLVDETMDHEVAHAMYCLDDSYRAEVDRELATLDLSLLMKDFFDLGYAEEVMQDEANAYLATEGDDSWACRHGIKRDILLELFNRYKKQNIWQK